MSWISTVLIIMVVSLLAALAATEWFVRRRSAARDGDRDSLV